MILVEAFWRIMFLLLQVSSSVRRFYVTVAFLLVSSEILLSFDNLLRLWKVSYRYAIANLYFGRAYSVLC